MRKEFKVVVSDEDDINALEPYINGPDWKLVVWDFDQLLRKKIKYGEHSEQENEIYEKLREELYTILNEYDLTLG